MRKSNVHVVKRDDGWAVRRENAERDSSHHRTQAKAIDAARDTAKRERLEVVIHDQKNRIRDKDSYGNDPVRSRDRKH